MTIRSEREGPVLIVTMDRPEARNALSLAMREALIETWRDFRDDSELRVAILTGAGEKSFCAGADLKEIGAHYAAMSPIERRERGEREPGFGGLTRNLDVGKPVIAAINGHCLAGGLELALASDIRIAAEHATFGLTEVRWGLLPGGGGTQRLPRLVPLGLALEVLLTAQPIDAGRALAAGLVNQVVAADKLLEAAREMAGHIAANAPLAVQAVRAAALRGLHLSLDDGLRLEQFYAEPLRQSEDVQEGLKAFAEKCPPRFVGK